MKTFYSVFALFFALALAGCDTNQPQVATDALKKPSIDHAKFTAGCPECHEQDRLPPTNESTTTANLITPHGFGGDCVQCHSFPLFKTINGAVLAHNPTPVSCTGCHASATTPKADGTLPPHPPLGDCAQCHSFPDWSKIKTP